RGEPPDLEPVRRARPADRAPHVPHAPSRAPAENRARSAGHLQEVRRRLQDEYLGADAPRSVSSHRTPLERGGRARTRPRGGVTEVVERFSAAIAPLPMTHAADPRSEYTIDEIAAV